MYIVLEIWEPTAGEIPQTMTYPKETQNEAMSSYHYLLSQAAVSQYYRHGAIVMTTDGRYLARESFEHERSEEPEEVENDSN